MNSYDDTYSVRRVSAFWWLRKQPEYVGIAYVHPFLVTLGVLWNRLRRRDVSWYIRGPWLDGGSRWTADAVMGHSRYYPRIPTWLVLAECAYRNRRFVRYLRGERP